MATRSWALGVVILTAVGACGGGVGGRGATGGAGGGAVDPNGTEAWTWHQCGTIPATPAVKSQGTDIVRFVPDGRVLAMTRDNRALLFQPAQPSAPPTMVGASGGSPAFSLDGGLFAESSGAAISVRRVADGTLVRELALPAVGGIACTEPIALSTSGAHLLARGEEGMCVYDLVGGRLTARLPLSWGAATFWGDTEELVAVTAFNPAVGFTLARLDESGTELGRAVVPRDGSVSLSPDGRVAASVTAAEDGVYACSLWSTNAGAELWSASARLEASWTAGVPAFSARGDLAALCGAVVHTGDGTPVREMISRAAVVAVHGALEAWDGWPSLSPDGRHVLGIDDWGGGIVLLELDSGRAVPLGGHTSSANTPFISISASRDGKVLVSNTGGELLAWKTALRFEDWTATWLTRGRTTFPRMDVSADGRSLAISGDGRLVYDLATGAVLPVGWSTPSPTSDPSGRFCWPELRFSGDGRWLAGVDWDPVLRIRQASGGQGAITELATGCVRVAISSDSHLLATSEGSVYRLEGGEQLVAGTGGALSVWSDSVEFSPDQTHFVVSSECSGAPLPTIAGIGLPWEAAPPMCHRVEVHATSDGHVVRALPTSMGRYPSFSPDGSWIVTGGGLYHVPTGTSRSLDGDVRAATFTADGDIIAGDARLNLVRYCRR